MKVALLVESLTGNTWKAAELIARAETFMGVKLLTTELQMPGDLEPTPVAQPSPEAEECRRQFLELARLGAEPATLSSEAFAGFMRNEVAKYSKIIRDAGIKVE